MKLKCIDGKVRRFIIPKESNGAHMSEARCKECGEEFGVHDTFILKPIFKKHICKKEK